MNAFEASEPLHGAIDGMRGDVLQGWAIDRRDPGLRLAVEVYIDHVFVALARADREQPFDSAGDGFHGFAVQLRPAWLENAKQVAVRIANGGPWLDGALERPFGEQRDNVTAIASQVWHTGGLKIKGWAWDPASPPRHVSVSAREGLHHIASGIANRLHPALIDRTTADHGFDIDLPWALADGCLHTIHIETDEGIPVTGSPIQLCVHPEGLAALVQKFWPSTAEHDERSEEVPALLTQLAETCDLHAPRSAGFSHYPRWHAVFQQPAPIQPVDGVTLVILLGNGTSEAWAATRLSIEQQRLPAEQIRVIAPQDADLFTEVTQHLGAARIIVPVRVGDRLAGHALDTCLSVLNQSCAAWAYSDCDQDDSQGRRTNPWFKPCWDETLFYGMDIVSSGGAFSSLAIAEALQRLAPLAQEASLGWHWLLAGVVAANDARVVHIPAVLYHRAADAPATPYSSLPDSRRHASLTWLAQQRMAGAVVDAHPSYPGLSRAIWPLPNALPVISLIVPTRDHVELLRACIEGLAARTDYPALEIIVVDNGSRLPETLEYLQRIAEQGIRVLPYPHAFNYAAINNWAVEQANGSIVGLVNNDIDVLEPGWLKEMLAHLLRPGIGAVGAKLMWPNGMVQHGGVVVGINGLAAHTGNELNRDDPGYLGFNQIAREQSVVTAACLLMRKHDYQRLGGLDEERFPVAFNDVDLCMRLRSAGKRIVWTPFAPLVHAESASRGKEDTPSKAARAAREQRHFIERWSQHGQSDPYYHPCLSADYLAGPYGGLALPPRNTAPRCADHTIQKVK